MRGLFKKKEVDVNKVKGFCSWFIENNARIIESVNNASNNQDGMIQVLNEVENQLGVVYCDGHKRRVEFEYGFNGKNWELNLYHLNDKFLITATKMIQEEISANIADVWKVNVDK